MCKPPKQPAVPIPGRRQYAPHDRADPSAFADATACLNCGGSLKSVLVHSVAKHAGVKILGQLSESLDRERFCTMECLYSHAFRTDLLDDDDD